MAHRQNNKTHTRRDNKEKKTKIWKRDTRRKKKLNSRVFSLPGDDGGRFLAVIRLLSLRKLSKRLAHA